MASDSPDPPRASRLAEVVRAQAWPGFVLAAMWCTSFVAGVFAYDFALSRLGYDKVQKDTYVLKKDLVGRLSTAVAVREIEHLIEMGSSLSGDEARTRVWLLMSLTFIQTLDLTKDREWEGRPVSAFEANIRFAQSKPTLAIQAQETLGVLKGMRAGVQALAAEASLALPSLESGGR